MAASPEDAKEWQRFAVFYAVVRGIPSGCLATYGQIAELSGLPGRARQVGRALSLLPIGSDVPWFRVVNAAGRISLRRNGGLEEQRKRLQAEGVEVSPDGKVPLRRRRWRP